MHLNWEESELFLVPLAGSVISFGTLKFVIKQLRKRYPRCKEPLHDQENIGRLGLQVGDFVSTITTAVAAVLSILLNYDTATKQVVVGLGAIALLGLVLGYWIVSEDPYYYGVSTKKGVRRRRIRSTIKEYFPVVSVVVFCVFGMWFSGSLTFR